jgi:hypothetical protein
MPNERRRHRAAKRVDLLPRVRLAPVLLFGLVAVALLGRTPHGDAPVRWAVRDAGAWMTDWDGVREVRLAALVAGSRVASADTAPVATVPSESRTGPIVVAEADLAPRDVRKTVPRDAADPEVTGAVPKADAPDTRPSNEPLPIINRSGKGDRMMAPTPLGRTTDHDLFVKPTLATVAPTQEGWPPLMRVASFIAPQTDKILPRLALAAPDPATAKDRIIVAMVRSGPGSVVTQSAIAALAAHPRPKGRPLLPPMPDQQMAAANPRLDVWAQPPMPEMGYARRNDIEARFKAVLGEEDGSSQPAPRVQSDDDLPP